MLLVISPKYGAKHDAALLKEAAKTKNIDTTTLVNSWSYTAQNIGGKMAVAPYGEHAFCEFIAQEMNINLYQNCLDWTARLPHHFLKRTLRYMTLGDVIDAESQNQSILGKRVLEPADEPCFLTGIWDERFPRVPKDTPVLVHGDDDWMVKYRFIIINGQIADYCCYKVCNIFNTPSIWRNKFNAKGVTEDIFVTTLLNHFRTAPACVLDVGYIKDTGWSVWNTYPIWSSEIYGCDPYVMLKGIFTACKQMPEN